MTTNNNLDVNIRSMYCVQQIYIYFVWCPLQIYVCIWICLSICTCNIDRNSWQERHWSKSQFLCILLPFVWRLVSVLILMTRGVDKVDRQLLSQMGETGGGKLWIWINSEDEWFQKRNENHRKKVWKFKQTKWHWNLRSPLLSLMGRRVVCPYCSSVWRQC